MIFFYQNLEEFYSVWNCFQKKRRRKFSWTNTLTYGTENLPKKSEKKLKSTTYTQNWDWTHSLREKGWFSIFVGHAVPSFIFDFFSYRSGSIRKGVLMFFSCLFSWQQEKKMFSVLSFLKPLATILGFDFYLNLQELKKLKRTVKWRSPDLPRKS